LCVNAESSLIDVDSQILFVNDESTWKTFRKFDESINQTFFQQSSDGTDNSASCKPLLKTNTAGNKLGLSLEKSLKISENQY
jgi:hypothetical protein